jgi:AcrR family transcriptional regulator
MREQIKLIAAELLIKHGYRGVSFRAISEVLNTTRANLHYHFGSKDGLVEEVLEDYVKETLDRYQEVWLDKSTTLREKVEATVKFTYGRYQKYNPDGDKGEPWSLMVRLRSDSDALTPKMNTMLHNVMQDFENFVRGGVSGAIETGELDANTPQERVVIQLVTIIHYAGLVTRDHGRFGRLAELWEANLSAIELAYGRKVRAKVKST